MRAVAYAWTHRSEKPIPDGRLTQGIHGVLLLFKRMLKRREVHFITGASVPLSALSLVSLRGNPELCALGYICGTLISHGMLFSTLPIIDSSGAVAAHSSDGVSVDHASFLRMLMSPIGLDSRNWKCRRTAIGMLMALLHKLEPSTDEPIFYQQSNTEIIGLSALDALTFSMTGEFAT